MREPDRKRAAREPVARGERRQVARAPAEAPPPRRKREREKAAAAEQRRVARKPPGRRTKPKGGC